MSEVSEPTPRSPWPRRIGVVLVNVVLALAFCELAAFGVARVQLGQGYAAIEAERLQFLQRVPAPIEDEQMQRNVKAGGVPRLNLTRELHPYFGFTFMRDMSDPWRSNNAGFMSSLDYPYRKQPGELVVAILGGSVAQALGSPRPTVVLRQTLQRALAARGYTKVTILMLAQGAWRQPQSLFTFLYYMDSLDVAIFLEGFNEISELPLEMVDGRRGYPLDFPMASVFQGLTESGAMRDPGNRREIAALRAEQVDLTRIASLPLLRSSMLVHLLWKARIDRLERHVADAGELVGAPLDPGDRPYDRLYPRGTSETSRADDYLRRYQTFLQTIAVAGERQGKPVFFFLQPSQYVPGSKTFDPNEKSIAYRPDGMHGPKVRKYYPLLREMWRSLRSEGVEAHDLTMSFQDIMDPIYVDQCCHINEYGMVLIAEEIAARVIASPSFAALPSQ